MKSLIHPGTWSITGRLLLTATVPVLMMFIGLTTSLYVAGRSEVAETVRRNGQLLALALAQTSQYGVISGSAQALERSVDRMLETQAGIASVAIFDDRRQLVVSRGVEPQDHSFAFEQPITADVPEVDLFEGTAPHASTQAAGLPPFHTGRVAGYVRVVMSAGPVLAEQRQRIYLSAGAMGAAFVISMAVGLYLAQLMRAPLATVMRALRDIRQGNLDVRFDSKMKGEMGELQSAIVEMAKGLSVKRHELESEVRARTQQLQQAVERAQESDTERRRLIAHSNDLVEEERQRIAMELHDQFNASLLSVRLRASALMPRNGRIPDLEEVHSIAYAITCAVEQIYSDARQMVKRLRPEVLDTLGLNGAIREAVRMFNQDQTHCLMGLEIGPDLPVLAGKVSIAAYRIVQEALTNVLKHSGANRGMVILRFDAGKGMVAIEVSDNGLGFDTRSKPSGFGLLGMRERVDSINGDICIQSNASCGTKLLMHFPVLYPLVD